ncbi:MAG: hypothetical protein KGL11_09710 [Alphaproteobacteria bacterium]|nr:hypothetical protein [Alphaproteobacteria bacterium]
MIAGPINTTGVAAKVGDAVKNWPLWLLVAVALGLTTLALVPAFCALVPAPYAPLLWFAVLMSWIVVGTKSASHLPAWWSAREAHRAAQMKFVATPIESQSFWAIAKQPDGSYVTQITVRCMVKNRTGEPLHLLKAKLLRPKISGEELPGLVTMQAPDSNMHGTAYVSGYNIPAGQTLPASAVILIRGMPNQRSGTLAATVEFQDADANRVRIPIVLNMASPSGPPRTNWLNRFGVRGKRG